MYDNPRLGQSWTTGVVSLRKGNQNETCSGTVFGPLFGAFLLSGISEVLATKMTSVASLFFGLVIVVAVVLIPRGLVDLTRRIRAQGWRYFSHNIRSHRL